MTLEQVILVQQSFGKILLVKQPAGEMFYKRLFELDPSLRALFKGDMNEQSKKFMDMIEMVVSGLNEFDDLIPVLRELGERHKEYGVQAAHYETVEAALLWMLRQVLGDEFTRETEEAWSESYGLLARAMLELPSGIGSTS